MEKRAAEQGYSEATTKAVSTTIELNPKTIKKNNFLTIYLMESVS